MSKARKPKDQRQPSEFGRRATVAGMKLRSFEVGALPIIHHILRRMRLPEILSQTLPKDDARTQLATHRGLILMVYNVLVSREPIYGVGQWAAQYAPDLLDLWEDELELLNDDRVGRCLDRLFDGLDANLIMTVVRQVVKEFRVNLNELHNDSTSLAFFGAYTGDDETREVRGRKTLSITYGHSKDHRPDLKQLLYILTVSEDGGVPIYFTAADGNTTDDTTHRATWDLLRELVGREDFLYVADCKLASEENMNYIARKQGRFITVLPRSRKEAQQFRKRVATKPDSLTWEELYRVTKTCKIRGKKVTETVDQLCVCADEQTSKEGYRLLWYRSSRKIQQDRTRRAHRIQRAIQELLQLRDRLQGSKTRFRDRGKVRTAVHEILKNRDVESLLDVEIVEEEIPTYKQARKGRPTKDTQYIKTVKKRFDISWSIDNQRQRAEELQDGIFPLVSNVKKMTAEEILRAYKRQPVIEKRFSQLKTDFSVAPVYLKSVTRIHGLLAVYFFALMVQALLERELRQAMQRNKIDSLPLYPEGRPCRRPTTRKLIDLFAGVQRHEIKVKGEQPQITTTKLSALQKLILKLLGIPANRYGE